MTAEPGGISVIVPTFGSPRSVDRLLTSLSEARDQLPAGTPSEVIVVDDSGQADAAEIDASCRRHGARYLRGPKHVGAKRNAGARVVGHELLFFIDSDCVADPDLLRVHLLAHGGQPAMSGRRVGAVAGPTIVTDAETAPAWRIVRSSVVVNSPWLWPARFAEVWWAATANLSVSREAFEAAGGFDERTYTVVGGEDVDFGVRLTSLGYATVCRPDAVVTHATDGITKVGQFREKMFRYGRACVYNCSRQPEHAQWSANPVSLTAVGLLLGTLCQLASSGQVRRAGRWLALLAPAAAGGGFAARVARAAGADSMPLADAAGMVSVDWAFHAGITAEAVRRRRPWRAFQRYDYFPSSRFYPVAAQPEDSR